MTDVDLDRLIAEKVCGWPIEAVALGMYRVKRPDRSYMYAGEGQMVRGQWWPSRDLNQAREAETRLPEDKWIAYEEYLTDAVRGLCTMAECADLGYRMITADARTRCIAMLRTLGIEVKE